MQTVTTNNSQSCQRWQPDGPASPAEDHDGYAGGYTTPWNTITGLHSWRVRLCWSIMLIALLADRIAPSCQAPTWLRCSPAK